MKRLDFIFWLWKRSNDRHTVSNRHRNMRCEMRNRLRSDMAKGRGNKAWKRADALERAWRASGGFYVEDFITM